MERSKNMPDTKEIAEKAPEFPLISQDSSKNAELVCRWWDRKQEADNGLDIALRNGTDAIGCVKFELKGKLAQEKGYNQLLSAKIFETFGVYNAGVAAAAFSECINCIVSDTESIKIDLEKGFPFMQKHCENVLSLFQEMRPRDSFELMIVTKMVILDYLSNREFLRSVTTASDEIRTTRQSRGIKLSRLLLEFKDKFDRHRKPEQQIHVQHNHIYNEGQAIIGSQLSTRGGR
jgi:hypothetical protein